MMGDKSFMFSASREAFLMYAKHGRTWAALHDPVGPRREWAELIRQFVQMAHAHNGRAAFYQVRADALPLYLDAGLTLMKLGEEAHVALAEFDLKGSHRAHLRYAIKRGERDGFDVEVLDSDARSRRHAGPARRFPMRGSDSREAREKSFSVAAFNDDYLAAQSVLLVRQQGMPVAFVTFMTTDLNTEATVGVMRHVPDASPYAMEYLFTKLALHLKQAGFQTLESWASRRFPACSRHRLLRHGIGWPASSGGSAGVSTISAACAASRASSSRAGSRVISRRPVLSACFLRSPISRCWREAGVHEIFEKFAVCRCMRHVRNDCGACRDIARRPLWRGHVD